RVRPPHPAALPALPAPRAPRGPRLVPLSPLRPPVPPKRPAAALSPVAGEGRLRAGVARPRGTRAHCSSRLGSTWARRVRIQRDGNGSRPPPPGASSSRRPGSALLRDASVVLAAAVGPAEPAADR